MSDQRPKETKEGGAKPPSASQDTKRPARRWSMVDRLRGRANRQER